MIGRSLALRAVDPAQFRRALGRFATGVTIITACDSRGRLVGFTANSFSSVSLKPPLVLFSIARTSTSLKSLRRAKAYAINILAHDQRDLSNRFASDGDRWADIAFEKGVSGAPLLSGATAAIECRPWAKYDGGDHIIFVGRVVATDVCPHTPPLLYFAGAYAGIETSRETVAQLRG
jgi:flavin reductase (DIM6/NTAB) family NADH-FMN oxidoreductase RutF